MSKPAYFQRIPRKVIDPPAVDRETDLTTLIDQVMLSYNGGRLREGCQLFARKMLDEDSTVGLALSGALTPAGLGQSCLAPLLRAGFIDWIVSTGANLYHDTHFALGQQLYASAPGLDDRALRDEQIIRIYDIVFDYKNLLDTDSFYRKLIASEPFQRRMGTAEFHTLVGKYLHGRDTELKRPSRSLLAVAYECGVPIYTSSPGDSSIGMNLAAQSLRDNGLFIDPLTDVNETAAIVYDAKKTGASSILILGGGSPKNFVLQTEPQIQEVLGLAESGHDYFLQFTDARPDTGGLSGATASEAMTWGKVDPERLPDSVTCYVDSTVALPLLTAYALQNHAPRPLRRLSDRRVELLEDLKREYLAKAP